ncbi:MAG: hypothetical protein EBT71_05935 [Alphaproteobacteria bacterium]|nr:hypothetical protein [Alphaproteobacteria bacterium]
MYLDDPIENLAIQMMKDAASRTASSAGDGTTTAIVLTEAIVSSGMKLLTKEHNVTEVIRFINEEVQNVIQHLKDNSKQVTPESLNHVATISARMAVPMLASAL